MKTTLLFPSDAHISRFVSVADNSAIDMNLENLTVTAAFNEKELQLATSSFRATVLWQQLPTVPFVKLSF